MHKPRLITAALAVNVLWSGSAFAQTLQPWLERTDEARIGVRVGDLEAHPGLAGEVGYDSNYFQSSGTEPARNVDEPIVPTLQFRLTPSLSLKTLSEQRKLQDGAQAAPPKLDFRSRLSGRFGRLYALDRAMADPVDRWTIGADLGANLDILPQRPWGASISAGFSRLEQPNSDPGNTQNAFDRNAVSGAFDVKWRPGGGLLEWSLGYRAGLTVFDNSALGLNYVSHGARTRGRWKFLPRTALLYEGSAGFVTHTQETTRQRDSTPISSQIGVNGLVTPRIGVLLFGGWKALFYEEDADGQVRDFDGPIGRAEVTWYFAAREELEDGRAQVAMSTWRLGYQRDAANSGIANFYDLNRVFTAVSHMIGRSWLVSLRGGVSFVSHPVPRDAQGDALTADGEGIEEWRPDAYFFTEYHLTDTIALLANTGFSASPADNYLRIPAGDMAARNVAPPLDNLKYFRYTAFIGARWFM